MIPRVLVVEDDELIRDSLLELLEQHGVAAEGAANGREALDQLAAATTLPALIVLDLMMPVMDGREFRAAQLRDPALAGIPVVVISAYRDLAELEHELQPVGLLGKPLKLAELLAIIRRHCPR